jgi:hypothetical protein
MFMIKFSDPWRRKGDWDHVWRWGCALGSAVVPSLFRADDHDDATADPQSAMYCIVHRESISYLSNHDQLWWRYFI